MTEPTEWELGTLDDVLEHVDVRNNDKSVDLVLSVTEGRGVVPQTEVFSKRIATEDTSKYKVLQPLDIAWNPYLLWTGAVGQWLGDSAGVTSPVYPVFRAREGQDARFWGLVLESGVLTPYFDRHAIGSIVRRRRTTMPVFVKAPTFVPPLMVQEGIVEVIGAVDAQIAALDTEAGTLKAVLRRRRADLITDDAVESVRAEYAFDFSTGVRRTPDRATGPYMTPYLRSANVGYGTLDLSDILEMNFDPAERKKFSLQYGDVVVSEGSASANAVGMPAMWRDEIPGPVCTQMTLLRLRALQGVCVPEFVFHWSMWAYESRAFLEVAGGTNIKHISAKRAKGMAVRLPSLDRQREIAAELDAMDSALAATRAAAVRLRAVRVALLSGLLDRTIDIESAELEI
ncbi:restriction endonuclease subunit S domain-containing protein [Nocardia stercoris]|nr:restriction endonuclease subunit S [Nocardia stercoris]